MINNKLYLHIGFPKTGTSALQVFFAKNRNVLFKLGIRYPLNPQSKVGEQELITSGNAAKIALYAFSNNSESQKFVNLLQQIMKNNKTILLSSEYFSNWEKDKFIALKDLANSNNFNPIIIVYLRDQADLIVTHYFQLLKRRPGYKDIGGFDSFAKKYITLHKFLDYFTFLEMLESIFSKENIIVNSIRKDMLIKGDLIQDFMERVFGIHDLSEFLKVDKINPTPTQQELYIKYLINKLDPALSFSDTYLKIISNLHALKEEVKHTDNFFIEPATINYIRNNFIESNKSLCDKWFKGKKIEEVFEQREYTQKIPYNRDTLDVETLIEIFGGLLVATWRKIEYLEKVVKK